MSFIDGILAPGTIKSGVYVANPRHYCVIGNFVTLFSGTKVPRSVLSIVNA